MIGILMLLFTPPFSEKSSIDLASFKLQANGKVSQNLEDQFDCCAAMCWQKGIIRLLINGPLIKKS